MNKEQWFAAAFNFFSKAIESKNEPFAFEDLRVDWQNRGYQSPPTPNHWGALSQQIIKSHKLVVVGRRAAISEKTHGHEVREYMKKVV